MPQFLNILLQKSDPNLSWGFDIVGGREYGLPLTICQVSSNSFSSQYLSNGDEIVQIEGIDASLFTGTEALHFIRKPSKSLDLVIFKRSKDDTLNQTDSRNSLYRKQTAAGSEKHTTILSNASAERIARRKVNSEKRKNYKRSSSVPSKYSSCGPPTYQLHYTVPDVDTNQNQRVNSIRNRSESPPFWRNTQNNAIRNENKNMRSSSRVFWRQMESGSSGITDTECDKEVAQYCRSRRDRWKATRRSDSIESSESFENTTRTTYKETSQEQRSRVPPVQFQYCEPRRKQKQQQQTDDFMDVNCDKEVAQFSRSRRDRWKARSNSIDSSVSLESTSMTTTRTESYTKSNEEYRYKIPVHFDYYEHREQRQKRVNFEDEQLHRQRDQKNVSKVYLSPYDLKMHKGIIQSLQPLRMGKRRQMSQTTENSPTAQASCESTPAAVPNCNNVAAPPAPPAPAPPPPPPPTMNGTIPTIRLKSEISDRCEPPAKIQNAMMKDKKPFTYTPGGIDLSEIKSPRMQRRIVKNAQTPDDIILPTPPPTVHPSTLPPSAIAAMTPQIAIPVFPQNGLPKKPSQNLQSHHNQSPQKQPIAPSPPPPPQPQPQVQKQTMTPPPPPQRRSVSPTPMQQHQPTRTIVVTNSSPSSPPHQQQQQQQQQHNQQPVRTIVINNSQPSPTPQNPASRTIIVNSPSSPTPQQQQQQQQQQSQPTRTIVITNSQQDKPKDQPRAQVGSIYIPPVTTEPAQNTSSKPSFPVLREAPTPWLQKNQQSQEGPAPAWVNRNRNNAENEQKEVIYERKPRVQQVQTEKEFSDSDKPVSGTRVIPIQIEGSNQTFNQPNPKPNSQRWGTPVNNQNAPSNQNNVNRGNVIVNSNKSFNEPDSKPIQSRSFKVIQRITGSEDDTVDYNSDVPYNTENVPLSQLRRLHLCDDDQAFMNKVKSQANGLKGGSVSIIEIKNDDFDVIPITIEVQSQERARPTPTPVKDTNEEPQKKYIPPSERQAEQDLRKYMGSSIPSRSFRMLQAMTSTQQNTQHTKRIDNIDEDARFLYPNPWPDPPKNVDEIGPFWSDYMYLFNLLLEHLPCQMCSDDSCNEYPNPKSDYEDLNVSDFHHDEYSENESMVHRLISNEPVKEELIIDEVIKDDSDHEVSLTVCIPLRRKSKSVEYYEEVTIKDHSETTKDDPTPISKPPIAELESSEHPEFPINSMEADTKHLESCDVESSSSSDTEHSESSSVDFWKEITTDEDMYFKSRPVTPAAETRPSFSACEDTATDDDGYFKPRSMNSGLGSHWESGMCDEGAFNDEGKSQSKPETFDFDGYAGSCVNNDEDKFHLKPKTPGFDVYQGSPICDELTTNQNNPELAEVTTAGFLESTTDVDIPKTPGFGRSESPPWYEGITDEDGYSRPKPKTSGSPPICDKLTTIQDMHFNSVPSESDSEDDMECDTCDELATAEDGCFTSRPKTPGFGRHLESPDWDGTNIDEDGCLKSSSIADPDPIRHQEVSNSNKVTDPAFRPKTPGFGRHSESPDWDDPNTNEDGYLKSSSMAHPDPITNKEVSNSKEVTAPTSRPKTPGVGKHPESSSHHQSDDTSAKPTSQDTWELGQDIKNYCPYTTMDSESSSTSGSSADDLDEPFENSSSTSSSDENDSYNVYEFSSNIPTVLPPEPPADPIPDTLPLEQDPINEHNDEDSGLSEAGKCTPETETLGSELRKLTKYQRANTHSRLLRILQEEEDKRTGKSELTVRKESLTLPLTANSWLTESVSSSSGINSPLSPVINEKLVNELVQSLVNSKGLGYYKLPAEKLREAAIKSLYESCSDTSRACSPYNCSTDKSKHTSQDADISQTDCYESYDENSVYYPGFDIFPSRAFKNLQSGRSTPMNWPKCPLLSTQPPDSPTPNKLNSTQDANQDR
ncbi:uncharacterized protein LOC135846364 isoform X3 [Planococcus citri]|uniref:uncharacterized protein LOC135846364 isoform X3 n=1 Tax=Planococcus citri TaxID=170843 RepID=UPI0031FA31A1